MYRLLAKGTVGFTQRKQLQRSTADPSVSNSIHLLRIKSSG